MFFYSFFKPLVGKELIIELKNDLSISGVLDSVDQYLNIKLTDINVTDPERYPHGHVHKKMGEISQFLYICTCFDKWLIKIRDMNYRWL